MNLGRAYGYPGDCTITPKITKKIQRRFFNVSVDFSISVQLLAIKVTLIFTDFRALWKYSALKTLRSWRKETLSGENYDVVHHQQQLTTCDTFSQTAIKSNCFHFLLQKTRDVAQIFGKIMLRDASSSSSSTIIIIASSAAAEINSTFSATLDIT